MSLRISELIERLQSNSEVVGLVRYGSRTLHDTTPGGDLDLFVVVRSREPQLESIHFDWDGLPVDLGLRTLEDLDREEPVSWVDQLLVSGDVIYDQTGRLRSRVESAAKRWECSRELPENEIALCRFYQQHVLNKVDGRLTEDPTFSQMLLSINICWLMHIYFKVRALIFPGERAALRWFRENDPEVSSRIASFFATNDIHTRFGISVELTETVLEPIGGPWQPGEVIGIGVDNCATNLEEKANFVFKQLLGETGA